MIERVKKVIAYTGLSDRAFALKCGINQPTLFNQLKGLRQISIDTIRSIVGSFPEISGDWLLTGAGEMLRNDNKDIDRLTTLIDTINTLQDVINTKNETIAILEEQIKLLSNK